MKFLITREAEVPASFAFGLASDFITHEVRAQQAGLAVKMLTGLPVGEGSRWRVAGVLRGKPREAVIEILDIDPPHQFSVLTVMDGMTMHSRIAFVALTKRMCRIETETEVKPTTFRARLVINALRLVRPRVVRRMRKALTSAVTHLETLHRNEGSR